MKYVSDQRGIMPITAAILLVLIVAAGGLAIYNVSKSSKQSSETITTSPSPSASSVAQASPAATATPAPTPAPTDQELLVALLKAHYTSPSGATPVGTKLLLCKLESPYAEVEAGVGGGPDTAGGGVLLLKKSNGTWAISYEGQNLSESTAVNLGFPSGFSTPNPCTPSSPVLYTF